MMSLMGVKATEQTRLPACPARLVLGDFQNSTRGEGRPLPQCPWLWLPGESQRKVCLDEIQARPRGPWQRDAK